MPSTSNTVGKIAAGISYTLLSSSAAQAMKVKVPVYIFPADGLPRGKKLTLTMRDVDLDARLRKMPGIHILGHPNEIRDIIKRHIESNKKAKT